MKKQYKDRPENLDPFETYRAAEILPEVLPYLQQARKRRGAIYIPDYRIDKIIELQNEDIDKCITYIKYAFLGGASWLDVYGSEAEEKRAKKRAAEKQQQQIDDMQKKLDQILFMLSDLQKPAQPKKEKETEIEKYMRKNQIKIILPEYKKEA